jgi:antirestriction protein ArdC
MLESGVRPWVKPWRDGAAPGERFVRPLRVTGQAYRGINTVNLWAASMTRDFASPYWLTYRGAKELGVYVREGETGELAFYVGRQTRTKVNKQGEEVTNTFSFLKSYFVFNADQIDGLPDHYRAQPTAVDDSPQPENRDARAGVVHDCRTARTALNIPARLPRTSVSPVTSHIATPWSWRWQPQATIRP